MTPRKKLSHKSCVVMLAASAMLSTALLISRTPTADTRATYTGEKSLRRALPNCEEGPVYITFELLDPAAENAFNASRLNGRQITIRGEMSANFRDAGISSFVFVPKFGVYRMICCEVLQPHELIVVHLKSGSQTNFLRDGIEVTGNLIPLPRIEREKIGSAYRITDAKVVEK